MTDPAVWVPVAITILTVLGGLVAYGYQKSVDRKATLGELRRSAYQEVLVALQRHLHAATEGSLAELSASRARAFVVASDPVVKAMGDFFALAVRNQKQSAPDGQAVVSAYAAMVLAMRRDSFETSTLSKAEIISAAPVIWNEVND